MSGDGSLPVEGKATKNGAMEAYADQVRALEAAFVGNYRETRSGAHAVEGRAAAVDALVKSEWQRVGAATLAPVEGMALVAIGGYGRSELFPYSDVDLLFLLDSGLPEKLAAEPIRQVNQALWDAGLRVAAATRSVADCERFDAENVEFTLAILDARLVAGDASLVRRLTEQAVPKLITRERKRIIARLLEVTRVRHKRFGDTLFHLEPNVKECPGGLRDAHLSRWLVQLGVGLRGDQAGLFPDAEADQFLEARAFLVQLRTFLHLRYRRDHSVLDWQSQDAAAAVGLGIRQGERMPDAALWMRLYFRHARAIARHAGQAIESAAPERASVRAAGSAAIRRIAGAAAAGKQAVFEVRQGDLVFRELAGRGDNPAQDPDVALAVFGAMADSGARLPPATEEQLEAALPALATQLEDGPVLWRRLQAILTGTFAGRALRAMHALGILELLVPEFHGVDALVIRDAYHRYTVDEHTFVVIDTLHSLRRPIEEKPVSAAEKLTGRFAALLSDLPHPELLFLAALLHDTGKGHTGGDASGHAQESVRMGAAVLRRLELDSYESGLVVDLIRNHLEMSAAMRRDIFDPETIRSFAEKVATPEALKMLTLFTYADIAAVHPGALTPWKQENLWLLYIAAANYLDRNVDDVRIVPGQTEDLGEKVLRVRALLGHDPEGRQPAAALDEFLGGLPRRYLETRTPEQVTQHFGMAGRVLREADPVLAVELALHYASDVSELTLVARDRPMLFAATAGALAAWGMNIVTAEAFSNGQALVVDSFRFTDTFRTLELNESERERFTASVAAVLCERTDLEALLSSRRRMRQKAPKVIVEARVELDQTASSHSTMMQVVAQDVPGLLRVLSLAIAEQACNVEVALVDTEGEMAIDVFYVTRDGAKLQDAEMNGLREALLAAIGAHGA